MDYLLRDAHYTGLNYGTYDRDYLLHHFGVVKVGEQEVLAIKHNALHCVEDFLSARFAWYSQVVRSGRGAKYDALAEDMTFYLLEKGKIYSYSQLLDMAANDPMKFYGFNDHYFMGLIHSLYIEGFFDKNPRMQEIAEALLLEKSPRSIRLDAFRQRILNQDDPTKNEKIFKKAQEKVEEIKNYLKKHGSAKDWVVADIPRKNIVFVTSKKRIVKEKTQTNILLERDPVKILSESGEAQLLVDLDNSVISSLQSAFNFVPNVFCSESAYQLLLKSNIIDS
jgi:HD superfamily phosphohydrolase